MIETLNEYQRQAAKTAGLERQPNITDRLTNAALGLTGESGEFADEIKKIVYHGHPVDAATEDRLMKELGDILWYVAWAATALYHNLNEIATMNIEKLQQRYPDRFSTEHSLARVDIEEAA